MLRAAVCWDDEYSVKRLAEVRARGLQVIEATCPLVQVAHRAVRERIPRLRQDRVLSGDIAAAAGLRQTTNGTSKP